MFKPTRKKKGKANKTNSVPVNEVLVQPEETGAKEEIETELYIPESWDVTDEERYVYAFHNTQSPKLKPNQISIYSMELLENEYGGLVVTGLIRNSVSQPILFEQSTILLLGPDQEVIAKKEFDLSRLGTIPSLKAVPWKFEFSPADIELQGEVPASGWQLAFQLKSEHRLELDQAWEASIAEETKTALEKIVAEAPPLKPGELNFMGLEAKLKEDGNLVVTFLIRNGTDKNVNIEQLPMAVSDATQEEIARGVFKLEDFEVRANTSKPWSFIFPASMVSKENPDLSRWRLYAIQD